MTAQVEVDWRALNEQVQAEYECAHAERGYRRRLVKVGTLVTQTIWQQCVRCGKTSGQAIAKEQFSPEQIALMPPFDEELQNDYYRRMQERREEIQRDMQRERSRQWWAEYQAYLATPEWQRRRALVLKRDNHTCQGCLNAPAVQAHHLTYEHFKHEFLWELIGVCLSCHERLHGRSIGDD